MNPDIFSRNEQKALNECLNAIKELPIFLDNELGNIFGLSIGELNEIEEKYPNWNFYDDGAIGVDNSWLAVNNAFIWFFNGTDKEKNIMRKSISFDEVFMKRLHEKFKKK